MEPYGYLVTDDGGERFTRTKPTARGFYFVEALYKHPPVSQERSFCQRCGKRIRNDADAIHTCSPPRD